MTNLDGRGSSAEPAPARPGPRRAGPTGGTGSRSLLLHCERGVVTAETALVIPVVVILLATLLAAAAAGLAQLRCIDAARAGARAAARHDDPHAPAAAEAPAGAQVRVSTAGELVKVRVSAQLTLPLPWQPRIGVSAESTAQTEPGPPEGITR